MILGPKQATRLESRARNSELTVRDLILNTEIRLANDLRVWGQYLDTARQTRQHGIYGTSAAIQILIRCGLESDDTDVTDALAALPLDPSDHSIFDAEDQSINYKCFFIYAAASCVDADGEALKRYETLLAGRRVGNRGWGDFAGQQQPTTLATAVGLSVLAGSDLALNTNELIPTLSWLTSEVVGRQMRHAFEEAFVLIALTQHKDRVGQVPGMADAIRTVRERLESWADTRSTEQLGTDEQYHYEFPAHTRAENKYMHYVSDLLVGRALVLDGETKRARSYVAKVVQHACGNIEQNRGYYSRSKGRIATADQLSAVQLLQDFRRRVAQDPRWPVPIPVAVVSGTGKGRALATVVLLGVSLLGGYLSFIDDASAWVKALGLVAITLGLGVLAALAVLWLGG